MTTNASVVQIDKSSQRNKADFAYFAGLFRQEFPTEESAVAEIARRRINRGSGTCPHCLSSSLSESGQRYIQCPNCNRGWWLTAGTLLHRAREILPWLAVIWFLERGITFVPAQLADLFGSSTSTIAAMKKKVELVICSKMGDAALISSAEFAVLYCRRTSETPAKGHPKDEQEAADCQQEQEGPSDQSPGPAALLNRFSGCLGEDLLSETEQRILACVGSRTILFDAIVFETGLPVGEVNSGLMLLELRGLIRSPSIDYYARVVRVSRVDSCESAIRDEFLKYIKCHFQGIGRKYVQLYLGSFWCIKDRKRWGPGVLLDLCVCFREVTNREVKNYVSPLMVKIL